MRLEVQIQNVTQYAHKCWTFLENFKLAIFSLLVIFIKLNMDSSSQKAGLRWNYITQRLNFDVCGHGNVNLSEFGGGMQKIDG